MKNFKPEIKKEGYEKPELKQEGQLKDITSGLQGSVKVDA
jgi:hypothetical protein